MGNLLHFLLKINFVLFEKACLFFFAFLFFIFCRKRHLKVLCGVKIVKSFHIVYKVLRLQVALKIYFDTITLIFL